MKTIVIRTQFSALHQYEHAPENVAFLRHPHRHVFKVEVEIKVEHGDRELEFFNVKYLLDHTVISELFMRSSHASVIKDSCEDMAGLIAHELVFRLKLEATQIVYVEVSEDGENAGRYYPE